MSDEIAFLSGLFDDDFGPRGLHTFFAGLRAVLVELSGDPGDALYSPLGVTGPRAGSFRLHADLYGPEVLLNVFDKVPGDGSGESVFLSVPEFASILSETPTMTADARRDILLHFAEETGTDRYNRFFDLVYGRDRPWGADLERRMRERQLPIRLDSGQGYLIHDRRWLHGREAPTGGVAAHRLHRLVFHAGGRAGGPPRR